MITVTPSHRIGSVACCRVYLGGHTFRLARGDSHVVVFAGSCIEQRQWLVIDERRFPTPVIAGPRPFLAMIARPAGLQWSDERQLSAVAQRWLNAHHSRALVSSDADGRPGPIAGTPAGSRSH